MPLLSPSTNPAAAAAAAAAAVAAVAVMCRQVTVCLICVVRIPSIGAMKTDPTGNEIGFEAWCLFWTAADAL